MSITVGSIVDGKVSGITKFGAFIEIEEGVTGLVHISEVANVYVNDIKEFLKENDIVKVKVLNMEPGGKIGLSIKQAMEQPPPVDNKAPLDNTFEEKLARFMKDSNEKLIALKKHQEGKKGR